MIFLFENCRYWIWQSQPSYHFIQWNRTN